MRKNVIALIVTTLIAGVAAKLVHSKTRSAE